MTRSTASSSGNELIQFCRALTFVGTMQQFKLSFPSLKAVYDAYTHGVLGERNEKAKVDDVKTTASSTMRHQWKHESRRLVNLLGHSSGPLCLCPDITMVINDRQCEFQKTLVLASPKTLSPTPFQSQLVSLRSARRLARQFSALFVFCLSALAALLLSRQQSWSQVLEPSFRGMARY